MTETIQCKCGIFVQGKSSATVKENLKKHMESDGHNKQLARKMLGGGSEGGDPTIYRNHSTKEIMGFQGYNYSDKKIKELIKDFEANEKKKLPIYSSKDLRDKFGEKE